MVWAGGLLNSDSLLSHGFHRRLPSRLQSPRRESSLLSSSERRRSESLSRSRRLSSSTRPPRRSSSDLWRRPESKGADARDRRTGWCSGRLRGFSDRSDLSASFLDRAAACFSQTSLDLRQISSICSLVSHQLRY
jgi:hypothetical protein